MKKIFVAILLILTANFSFAGSSNYPARGTTMDDVISQSGEPDKKLLEVGEPPITRWIYPGYTVYFEHQVVIHAVKNDEQP